VVWWLPGPMTPSNFIRAHLPLTAVPGLPGLVLHLAAPSSGLRRLTGLSPYWAYVWAGGLVLAHYVRDHPDLVQSRRVLDLGAGSGLVGIVAAQGGAQVWAADSDVLGQLAIRLNAQANAVEIEVLPQDIMADEPPRVDLILVGDLFYDAALVTPMLDFLDRAMARGVEVLVGDPGRASLPLQRLTPLATYDVPDFGRLAPLPATVFRLRPKEMS
jgi:predicted nicotinamide N-methyase